MYPLHVAAPMYACPHCDSTKMFIAYKAGSLIRVLEDHEDVEGLDAVGELLCVECNLWFDNPYRKGAHDRLLVGELVTITGLRGKGTIKVVAAGRKLPFHYDSYETEVADALRGEPLAFVEQLKEFASRPDHTLALRVKEEGNPNTWVYRIDKRRLWKRLKV